MLLGSSTSVSSDALNFMSFVQTCHLCRDYLLKILKHISVSSMVLEMHANISSWIKLLLTECHSFFSTFFKNEAWGIFFLNCNKFVTILELSWWLCEFLSLFLSETRVGGPWFMANSTQYKQNCDSICHIYFSSI